MTSKSEASYIQTSLLEEKPLRADGRSLLDFRDIRLATNTVLNANGSSRVSVGGTEAMAVSKLEVEDVDSVDDGEDGRISCSVIWFVPQSS
jgi:exosome complex component RRP42